MIKRSIRRRIVAIAVGLIVLMLATSVLSMVMVGRVGHLLDELTARYAPANTHLARVSVLSLERALALRRMVIAKMQEPPDVIGYRTRKELYDAKDAETDVEAQAARKLKARRGAPRILLAAGGRPRGRGRNTLPLSLHPALGP